MLHTAPLNSKSLLVAKRKYRIACYSYCALKTHHVFAYTRKTLQLEYSGVLGTSYAGRTSRLPSKMVPWSRGRLKRIWPPDSCGKRHLFPSRKINEAGQLAFNGQLKWGWKQRLVKPFVEFNRDTLYIVTKSRGLDHRSRLPLHLEGNRQRSLHRARRCRFDWSPRYHLRQGQPLFLSTIQKGPTLGYSSPGCGVCMIYVCTLYIPKEFLIARGVFPATSRHITRWWRWGWDVYHDPRSSDPTTFIPSGNESRNMSTESNRTDTFPPPWWA